MTTPKLSVLMTVRNGERFLPAAVESILEQTFTDFELLIRDDGSDDGTHALLRAYAARDSRVKVWVDEPNLGIVRSMNTLFGRARGEYVNRHDADDVSVPDRYAQQVAFLDAHPETGLVGTPVEIIGADDVPVPVRVPYFSTAPDNATIQQQLLQGCCFCQGSVMFRRALLEQVGAYDEALEQAEDYDLWLRMAEVTQLANLTTPLYRYRRHTESISSRRWAQQTLNGAQVIEKALHRRRGSLLPEAERLIVARRWVLSALASCEAGDAEQARERLGHAKYWVADIAEREDGAAAEALDYAGRKPVDVALPAVELLFRLSPSNSKVTRQRKKALARIRLQSVFRSAGPAQRARLDEHLWPAVRQDPTWLLNRGVWSLMAQAAMRRVRRRGSERAGTPR
jgi:glycosyltransferase involved in cell wall biosynthesis